MGLFECGEFVSHSGDVLPFKIDCDVLTDEDIDCIAEIIALKVDFGVVEGISRGGCRLADALEKYAKWDAPFICLVVDDVCTTGSSLEHWKARQSPLIHRDDIVGWVIFARGELPSWANAIFKM